MPWLLILMGIVVVILIFLLGTYSAEAPRKDDRLDPSSCRSCGGSSMTGTGLTKSCASKASGTCGSGGSNAEPTNNCDSPCRKHKRRRCNKCCHKETSDDGFSTGMAFISTPAPFA